MNYRNLHKEISLFEKGGLRGIFVFLCLILLTACSPLAPVSSLPMETYLLNDTTQPAVIKNKSSKILLVSRIATVPWLDSTKMAYQTESQQINYFAQNQWAATPSELLQPLVTQALEDLGNYRAVISAPYTGNYDQQLDITLLKMQQVFIQKPSYYDMALQVRLVNNFTQKVLATKRFEIKTNALTDNPEGGVAAANSAIQLWLMQLVQFVHDHKNA